MIDDQAGTCPLTYGDGAHENGCRGDKGAFPDRSVLCERDGRQCGHRAGFTDTQPGKPGIGAIHRAGAIADRRISLGHLQGIDNTRLAIEIPQAPTIREAGEDSRSATARRQRHESEELTAAGASRKALSDKAYHAFGTAPDYE